MDGSIYGIPTVAVVGFVSAAVTAAVTLLGVHITTRASTARLKLRLEHERQEQERQRRMERLENLYLLVHTWLNSFAAFTLPIFSVMEGKVSYNEALVMTAQHSIEVDFGRIEMALHMHVPELLPSFDALLAARGHAVTIIHDHKRNYTSGRMDGHAFLKPFSDACVAVDARGQELKKAIAELGRNLG